MTTIALEQTQTTLAEPIHRLTPGEEVVITENDQIVAQLVSTPGPRIDELLAAFPEPARERLWRWLEDPATVGGHLTVSPAATPGNGEATLGAVRQGRYERFAPNL